MCSRIPPTPPPASDWLTQAISDVSNFSSYWSVVDVRIVAPVCTCLGIFNQRRNALTGAACFPGDGALFAIPLETVFGLRQACPSGHKCSTELTAKGFCEWSEQKLVDDILGFPVSINEVIEIDDVLRPYCAFRSGKSRHPWTP